MKNTVAKICKFTAAFIMIIGVIMGFLGMGGSGSFMAGVMVWFMFFIYFLLLYSVGEGIQLLADIASSVSVLNDISKKNGREVELKAEEVEGSDEAPTEF